MNLTFAGNSSIQTPVKVNPSGSTTSVSGGLLKRKRVSSSQEDSGKVFNFGEARVREYLCSLSSDDSSHCSRSPGEGSKNIARESTEVAQPVIFSPKWKKTEGPEEMRSVPLFEDISSQGSVEVFENVTGRISGGISVEAGERFSSNDDAVSVCIISEEQQKEQQISPLRENTKRMSCDSDCVSVSGAASVTGGQSSDRLEGPLTRSRKRQMDDSYSSSSVGNGSCNGGSSEDGKVEKRRKHHLKRHHRHRHHRGGKRVKRIATITVE